MNATSPHRLSGALLLAVVLALYPSVASAASEAPVVQTTSGPVAGTVEGGLEVFRGIPYAAPPTGPLRWLPPSPVETWTEIRDATAFGPACPQDPDPHEMAEGTPTSEDCLTLNVWTPSTPAPRRSWSSSTAAGSRQARPATPGTTARRSPGAGWCS